MTAQAFEETPEPFSPAFCRTIYMTISRISLATSALVALFCLPVAAQNLPGGASALNEVHGDWQVACASQAATVRCALTHSQSSNDANRRRILAIELAAADASGAVKGAMVLPFGLRLDAGTAIRIDEQAQSTARFSTCLPVGCVVPLNFDADSMAAMKAGKMMTISGTIEDSGQTAEFSVPLNGLASGLDRISILDDTAQGL